MKDQCGKLALASRAFQTELYGLYCEKITSTFGYEKVMPTNTGVEATEVAVKIARRWAYEIKGVPVNEAKVVFAYGNFWGRSIAACGASDDPNLYFHFGPYGLNFHLIPYGEADKLKHFLETDPNVAAFVVEPVQGEGGIRVPPEDYLKQCSEICKKNNVLLIVDEIQTGMGRTGTLLACHRAGIKADIISLGKGLSGGTYPASCALADDAVMKVIVPGSHGSTYGGNPLASRVVMTSIDVLIEEQMSENAEKQGTYFREMLTKEFKNNDKVGGCRGLGLMNAIKINP
mmetsp:Transcript_27437/g.12779  ORF Transcript_27437/g.12779 Transcript_27437/m.12779 type:complete len:288 (-) Transcript_27437:240-1103(-)|eukprot:CAMPEP_0201281962 /NCGR_PEP_ID=MMETSP1317-20130820/4536_1 /ASSEMBLY_ACC=CAM_ASM_000770 /TAXON_ID=187299 /ORGANISM="Undescribed Undescribed, Strain Undescribed" /LENGTH=287 /DNA_ID=CAMNT_0047593411 /DNA_START=209 /DNA_END=1072 /DNA_ORIENTATION=-